MTESAQLRAIQHVCIFCRFASRPGFRHQTRYFRTATRSLQAPSVSADTPGPQDSAGHRGLWVRPRKEGDHFKRLKLPEQPQTYESNVEHPRDVGNRTEDRAGPPSPVKPTERCPSCGFVATQARCPLCQFLIPGYDTQKDRKKVPSQPQTQYQSGIGVSSKPQDTAALNLTRHEKPSSTQGTHAQSSKSGESHAVHPWLQRVNRPKTDEDRLKIVDKFNPDPRKDIPEHITVKDTEFMNPELSINQAWNRFFNYITWHLRLRSTWVCKMCGRHNQGKCCQTCTSFIYDKVIKNRTEARLIHRKCRCGRVGSPLEDNTCPGCHSELAIRTDIRSLPESAFPKFLNSDITNGKTKAPGYRSSRQSASTLHIGAENPNRADIESSDSSSSNHVPILPQEQTTEGRDHPPESQWASYKPVTLRPDTSHVRDTRGVGDAATSRMPKNIARYDMPGRTIRKLKIGPLPRQKPQTSDPGEISNVHDTRGMGDAAPSQTQPFKIHHYQAGVFRRVASEPLTQEEPRIQEEPESPFKIRWPTRVPPGWKPPQGPSLSEDEKDLQPYSMDEMDQMTRKARSGTFGSEQGISSASAAEQPMESQEPSRMDRRRTALEEDLKTRNADRRRGFRQQPRTEELLDFDDEDSSRHEKKRAKKGKQILETAEAPTPIYLPDFITVINLATALDINVTKFARTMRSLGFEDTSNDLVLDAETAGLIAAEFNFEAIVDNADEEEDLKPLQKADSTSEIPSRPPIVTIMGHVDHGKTTILDYLRKSSVAASEHGGITQHIGAFSVAMPSGRLITFLDTPGHKAFLDMRQRGANVTDIVILVVAADDSVKPQTIEAIRHAKGAGVQMIVAINKIDKEDADLDKVKGDLARNGVMIEEFGGDVQVVNVSGKTGQGMADLEEATIALADTLELRAPTDGPVEGWILEATTTKAGRVATILVRRGTLTMGQTIVAGSTWTKVRVLRNEAGFEVDSAGPGTPVEIDGWRDQPAAGDEVLQANDEAHARSVIDHRIEVSERKQMSQDVSAINEARRLEQEKREREDEQSRQHGQLSPETSTNPNGPKEVPLLIKADVSGSAEAVLTSLTSLGNAEVRPLLLRAGVGPVSETDVEHAATAKGHIVAFNTTAESAVRRLAEQKSVSIIEQSIIYKLMEDINDKLSEYLKPIITTKVIGEADVAQLFDITIKGRKTSSVAGCRVRNGLIQRNAKVRVLRGGETVYDGTFSSLKNRKADAVEMRKGSDCGMSFDGWTDFRVGDQIQTYEVKEERRTLN